MGGYVTVAIKTASNQECKRTEGKPQSGNVYQLINQSVSQNLFLFMVPYYVTGETEAQN